MMVEMLGMVCTVVLRGQVCNYSYHQRKTMRVTKYYVRL